MGRAGRTALIGCLAGAALIAATPAIPQSSLTQPSATFVKYSLADLPKKDKKRFWEAIDDLAILDVLMELCEKKRHRYDSRLRAQVKTCVDDASMARVQRYFNERRAHYTRTATPYACRNQKVMASMYRFRRAVDDGLTRLGNACSLCFFC